MTRIAIILALLASCTAAPRDCDPRLDDCRPERGDRVTAPDAQPAKPTDPDQPEQPGPEKPTDPGTKPDAPGKPDAPEKPGKPGHGHGDKNHGHSGPPGKGEK